MLNFFRGVLTNLGIVGEVLSFFWHHKFWWLIPMITLLLGFGFILIFANASGIAPFIYTLF